MAQYIFVKRKQRTNKRAPLAITLCLLFLFSSFNFVFADDLPTFEECFTYSSPGYNNGTTYDITSNSLICNLKLTNTNGQASFKLLNTDVHKYEFDVSFTSTNFNSSGSNSFRQVFFKAGLGEVTNLVNCTQSGNSVYGTSASGSFHFKQTSFASNANNTALFYVSTFDNTKVENDVEYSFSSFSVDGEDISLGGGWSGQATVSVEAGCVAYILVDGGTATLTTTFPELSKLSRPLWTSGSTYSFENDLPSSGKVFSSTSGTLIDWLIPASAKTDLLGRSYQGGRPLSNLPSGQFLVIYNPVYRGYDDKGVGIMSPTIYVSLSNYGAVRQFRLTASYNGGLIESTSDDGYSSWFDSIGEEELDANGNPIYVEHLANGTTQTAISIPAGGGNIVITDNNTDNSLGGLLERLLNLLTAPIKYIERLYNSAVQFFDYLSSLWGWLPVEVTSIIGAALAVLVVIGVVKFLWK